MPFLPPDLAKSPLSKSYPPRSYPPRASAAGAEIIEDPADQPYGDRCYGVRDPEGHHWIFLPA